MSEKNKIVIPKDFSIDKLEVSPDWFIEREKTLAKARVFSKVDTAKDNESAAAVLKEITRTLKKAEECRKDITRPLDAIKKSIMAAYNGAQDPLKVAQKWLKEKMVKFAEAEEQKRIEEKKKFEAEQAAKIEEQYNQHVEESKDTPNVDFKPVVEEAPVQKVAEKTYDSVVTKSLVFEVSEMLSLPKKFLKVDEQAIRAALKEYKDFYMQKCAETEGGVFESSGLKISVKTSVKSR